MLRYLKRKIKPFAVTDFRNEKMADAYQKSTSDDLLHMGFERPQMLKMVGPVERKSIAIAGSGPGFYAAALLKGGNEVTCIDSSEAMHQLASEKLADRVHYVLHDLTNPMPLESQAFDLIVSPLTIQYISDLVKLFSEFNRILKPGGRVIFSTVHPFVNKGENYFEQEEILQEFSEYKVRIRGFRRPLNHFFQAISQNGFTINAVHEPLPDQSTAQINEDVYQALCKQPLFIFFDIQKQS